MRQRKPIGKDLLVRERGSVRKKWKDQLPIALVFPNTYHVGMSNLGFQIVYSLLNSHSHIVCERVFLPESAGSRPVSVESGRPLADFPVVFCSISFEQDFLTLVQMLHVAEIDFLAATRQPNTIGSEPGGHLLVAGGVATAINPEPLAPYFDLMMIGEGEPVLPLVIDLLVKSWPVRDRHSFLVELASSIRGCYVPGLYDVEYADDGTIVDMVPRFGVPARIRRTVLGGRDQVGHSTIFSPDTEFAEMYLAELGRGCSRGCRFCAAGFVYRPPRLWSPEAIVRVLAARPADISRVGLLGMEMVGPADLKNLAEHLLEDNCSLSFSSLRADNMSDELLDLLKRSRLKSAAIAPDGGSERLRKVINKGITETDVFTAAESLVRAGVNTIKLYFMIGLPTETEEDLEEMVRLVLEIKQKILEVGRSRGRLSNLVLSVNSFVPKAWTPFQFHPFEVLDVLRRRLKYLHKKLGNQPNVRIMSDPPEKAFWQAVLARGDRRVGEALRMIAVERGNGLKTLIAAGIEPENFVYRKRSKEELFPWDIIDHGISRQFLWQEYQLALKAKTTPKCETAHCKRCGVCL